MKIVDKLWGKEFWIVNTSKYCGKKLILKKGYMCSLHMHKIKDETFYVIKGKMEVQTMIDPDKSLSGTVIILKGGDSIRFKPGTYHRFIGIEHCEFIEFSTHHKDSDSYRVVESCKL